ncbi:MAG: hypothetical protein A3K11_10880 [Nitrospirae bacterium RIFCSPLOWO2_12_FULL_63_8]|nr:MAG: hypothetical protein A3K11_10880 [Nitrospirae bacterium RIFCSPLOWO2_12_FULL_63_8]
MTLPEMPHPKDKVVLLKRIPLFAGCPEREIVLIADRTRLVEYKKGEVIYRAGDMANAFYTVVSGRLRVFGQSGGVEKTFTVLHNGDTFGEISLLTGETHSATVEAINDTLVLELQKADFEEVINRVPSLVLYLSRQVSKRLRMKDLAGEYAEAQVVAVYSAARGVGRSVFAMAMAAMLVRETRHPTILLSLGDSHGALYGLPVDIAGALVRDVEDLTSEQWRRGVVKHPLGFEVLAPELPSGEGEEQLIAPLLSVLTKQYVYILLDLPAAVNPSIFKALTQSDRIYLLTDQHRENFVQTKALVDRIEGALGRTDGRIRVVVNRMRGLGLPMSLQEMGERLGFPVASALPRAPTGSGGLTLDELRAVLDDPAVPFTRTIQRLARELRGSLIGLALGSGAALGLAHIGVLKVLEREHIPIDMVAGSSIGALVSGLWACGHSAEELEAMALRFRNPWNIRKLFILDFSIPVTGLLIGAAAGFGVGALAGFWTGLLFGFMVTVAVGLVLGPLAGGPIQGAELMAKLESDFAGKRFEETQLPLKIVAANPMGREEVVFESGSIAAAVRASVSIPGIFKPVMHEGKYCLDGGVANPVPVSVLKRAGVHRVIAVNVFPTTPELQEHLREQERRRAVREAHLASRPLLIRLGARLGDELRRTVTPLIFDVIMRSMQAMEYQIAEVACQDADITLRPTVPGSHWLEFFTPEKFIRRGEEVAMEHLPELKRLAGLGDASLTTSATEP